MCSLACGQRLCCGSHISSHHTIASLISISQWLALCCKAVDIIGLHYPSDYDATNYSACHSLDKPVWASEESSSYDDMNGAACWARVVNSHYVLSGITASIMWNLGRFYQLFSIFSTCPLTSSLGLQSDRTTMAPIGLVLLSLSCWFALIVSRVRYASSMLTAVQPWSGNYEINPVVWATAHYTQFTQVGYSPLAAE